MIHCGAYFIHRVIDAPDSTIDRDLGWKTPYLRLTETGRILLRQAYRHARREGLNPSAARHVVVQSCQAMAAR